MQRQQTGGFMSVQSLLQYAFDRFDENDGVLLEKIASLLSELF